MDEKKKKSRRKSLISLLRTDDTKSESVESLKPKIDRSVESIKPSIDASVESIRPSIDDSSRRPGSFHSLVDAPNPEEKARRGLRALFQPRHKKFPAPGESSKQMYMLERTGGPDSEGSMAEGSASSLEPKRRSIFAKIKSKVKSVSSSVTDLASRDASAGEALERSRTYSGSSAAVARPIQEEGRSPLKHLSSNSPSHSPSLLPPPSFSPTDAFECNMRYQTSDFLARIRILPDGLHISRAAHQGAVMSLEDVDHTEFTLSFTEIKRVEEESRTLLTIWTEAGGSMLCSAFTVGFERAYYSIVVQWNRVRAVGPIQDDLITHASDSEELVCECGRRHAGRLILRTDANYIPPISIYTALFSADGRYSVWNGASEHFKSVEVGEKGRTRIVMEPEVFGDLGDTREYQFRARKSIECPDHLLVYAKMQTLLRSYDTPLTTRLYYCVRKREEEPGIRIKVYLSTASTEYPVVNARARDLLQPLLIAWTEAAVNRLVEALPDEEEMDARMLIEKPTTWKCVVKALISFRLCPWLSCQLNALSNLRIFQYKETLLALLLNLAMVFGAARMAWRSRPCMPGFVPVEERMQAYQANQQHEQDRLRANLKARSQAIRRRIANDMPI